MKVQYVLFVVPPFRISSEPAAEPMAMTKTLMTDSFIISVEFREYYSWLNTALYVDTFFSLLTAKSIL